MISKNILALISMFSSIYDIDNEEWKKKILTEWRNSANYPRKKKKRVRKSLQIDWALANCNSLN